MGMQSTEHEACAKNAHIRYVRLLQTLLVFAAVAAAGTNFYFYTMHSHALPTTSVIYEINPILQNDGIFFTEGDENIWKTENFRDKLFQETATGLADEIKATGESCRYIAHIHTHARTATGESSTVYDIGSYTRYMI